MSFQKILAVDFDGVLCNSIFPEANSSNLLNKLLLWYVKRKQKQGWLIVLWTCRENYGIDDYVGSLDKALAFLYNKGLVPDAVNENMQERTDFFGVSSRKISADLYIDDKNIGLLGWILRTLYKRKVRNVE